MGGRVILKRVLSYTTYAVRIQTGHVFSITADFACGSMVLFILFHKNMFTK